MNKFYTLFFMLFVSTKIMFAESQLFLKINNNGRYQVFLNNESLTNNRNIFRFYDLTPGNYQLKVVKRNGWQQQIVFQEFIQIQNGFRYVAELNNMFGLQKIAQIPYVEKNWYIDQLNINQNWQNNHVCSSTCQVNNCNNNNWNNNNNNCNTNWNNNNNFGNNACMNNTTFQNLINTVNNSSFDDSKIQIIETALMNAMVQTNQVKQLIQLITFESNKLKLAKFCYKKTTDRQNYFDIYSAFSFNSSVNELNKYIANVQ